MLQPRCASLLSRAPAYSFSRNKAVTNHTAVPYAPRTTHISRRHDLAYLPCTQHGPPCYCCLGFRSRRGGAAGTASHTASLPPGMSAAHPPRRCSARAARAAGGRAPPAPDR
eukprot:scaffold7876_cov67-Phaeocystis_antarctica.AAC.11